MGRAGGKDPVNSLFVEGFTQKTLVTSPEVAQLYCCSFMRNHSVHVAVCMACHVYFKVYFNVQIQELRIYSQEDGKYL